MQVVVIEAKALHMHIPCYNQSLAWCTGIVVLDEKKKKQKKQVILNPLKLLIPVCMFNVTLV